MTERETLVKELERVVHCSHLEKVADFILAREAGLRKDYESNPVGAWKQASESWKQVADEKDTLITRLRSALENIRNNASYDSGKADTQHDRDRFEIIRQRAETALQGGSDGNDRTT